MIIYIVVFLLSIILYWKAVRTQRKNIRKIYLFLSILPPVLLAALREEHIGTDVLWYLKKCYLVALKSESLLKLFAVMSDIEPGFLTLVYVVTKITRNMFVLQGCVQLLIIVPVYYVIWKFRNNMNPTYAIMTYYFLFYMNNLNIMRQSIAVALSMLALVIFEDKKYFRAVIIQIIAITFHFTAILGCALIFIYWLISSKYNKIMTAMIVSVATLVIAFIGTLFKYLPIFIPLLRERYFDSSKYLDAGTVQVAVTIVYIINAFTILWINKKDGCNRFVCIMSYLSLLGIGLIYSLGSSNGGRIALYWNYYMIFSLPSFEKKLKKGISKSIFGIVYLICLFTYWWYNFVYYGWTETVPYKLGI